MARETLPLPFGGGLDRSTGPTAVDPSSFGDLRNVHLLNGKARLRGGLARTLLAPWGTDILGTWPLRAQGLGVAVIFDAASRDVRLYFVDASAAAVALVGTLWTIPASATLPPRVLAADIYDSLVLAHDEPVFAQRQPTMVYASTAGTLGPLLLDLARTGVPTAVKFRGVFRHFSYLLGWGYGTSTDPDRAETLRISEPGGLDFDPEHYFNVGVRGDPILAVDLCNGELAVYKAAETQRLIGYDRATFGMRPLDALYGIVASRAHVTVNGRAYFWSLDGPRVTEGGVSQDLALPLDLDGPAPDVAAGDSNRDYAFAFFDNTEREVVFVFGQWGYTLHLRDETPRWSYRLYGVELSSAGRMYTGLGVTLAIAAHPVLASVIGYDPPYSDLLMPGSPAAFNPGFHLVWNFGGGPALVGDEMLEIWTRCPDAGGGWARAAVRPAGDLAYDLLVTRFIDEYDIAIRLTRGGVPDAAYASIDPTAWPAASRVLGSLSAGTIQSFAVGRWYRVDGVQGVALDYVGPGTGRAHNPELTYRLWKSADAGATWTFVALLVDVPPVLVDLPDADYGTTLRFRIRAENLPLNVTAYKNTADKLIGVAPPLSAQVQTATTEALHWHEHPVTWVNGENATDAGAMVELRGQHAPGGVVSAIISVPALDGEATVRIAAPPNGAGITADADVRTVIGADVSAWVAALNWNDDA